MIEEVPTLETCANQFTTNEQRKQCTSDFVAKHVNMNFNTNLATQLGIIGRQRINVIFKIDTEGNVVDVQSRAHDAEEGVQRESLQEEAVRVIKTLPQFIPGKQKGKNVVVPYSLPILFQVNGKSNTTDKSADGNSIDNFNQNSLKYDDASDVPFSVTDEAPRFQGCEKLTNNDAIKNCTSQGVASYVNSNFNMDIAKQNGLTGRQRINVIFKIDKQGKVSKVRVRAPHKALKQEAIRVIRSLPQFTPGKKDGQTVVVPYSLPILFSVQ